MCTSYCGKKIRNSMFYLGWLPPWRLKFLKRFVQKFAGISELVDTNLGGFWTFEIFCHKNQRHDSKDEWGGGIYSERNEDDLMNTHPTVS